MYLYIFYGLYLRIAQNVYLLGLDYNINSRERRNVGVNRAHADVGRRYIIVYDMCYYDFL